MGVQLLDVGTVNIQSRCFGQAQKSLSVEPDLVGDGLSPPLVLRKALATSVLGVLIPGQCKPTVASELTYQLRMAN